MVLWRRFGTGLLFMAAVTLPALAGPNGGGTLIAVDANYVWTDGISDYCGVGTIPGSCAAADVEVDGSNSTSLAIWKVYAAFNADPAPRLKVVSFGVNYPYDSVQGTGLIPPTAFGPCIGDKNNGAAEFPTATWPGPGSGNLLVFQYTQTTPLVECYWFASYNYGGPALFTLGPHPDPGLGGLFGDDSVPTVPDSIYRFGSLGFDEPGLVVCPEAQGSCCNLKRGTCFIAPPANCVGDTLQYRGTASCDPQPCQTRGPCCIVIDNGGSPAWTCEIMTPDSCATVFGGRFYWLCGKPCRTSDCPGSEDWGACCVQGLACQITTRPGCQNYQVGGNTVPGIWLINQPCLPGNESICHQNIGACCTPQGACSMTLESACTGAFVSGAYCYVDTFCGSLGACCSSDGLCTINSQDQCLAPSTWNGAASCTPNPCPPGACCNWDGTCSVVTHDACYTTSAYWEGNAACDPNPCPAVGACCDADYSTTGICIITTAAICAQQVPPWKFVAAAECSVDNCANPVHESTWGRIKHNFNNK